jgi:hypothetical protein
MYSKETDSKFAKEDNSWSLEWNGCAWYLYRTLYEADLVCDDDVDAANVLFGNTKFGGWVDFMDQPYNADICAQAAAMGYCERAVFAGVCTATCGAHENNGECTVDNDAGYGAFLELQGETAMSCADAALIYGDALCDEDENAVSRALCKKTCKHSKYGDPDAEPKTVSEFKEHYGRRLYRLDSPRGGAPLARRLADIADAATTKEAMYVLMDGLNLTVHEFNPEHFVLRDFRHVGLDPAVCDTPAATPAALGGSVNGKLGVEQLTTGEICDLSKVGKDAGYALAHECPELTGYVTQSHAYCPWVNVDITDPVVAPYACSACATNDGPYCDGFDEEQDFEATSNALCAPREVCEDLCTMLGDDCISIDLVKGKNRCYLNRKDQHYCTTTTGDVFFHTDHVHTGAGGLQPPESPYHPNAPGLETGNRFPDRHIAGPVGEPNAGVRRLWGNKLWGSDSYVHARKDIDQTTIYTTQSNKFCRYTNINQTQLGAHAQHLCSACGPNNDTDDGFGNQVRDCKGYWGLDFGKLNGENLTDYMDESEALCLDREECEAVCTERSDCVSFDMHRTLPVCYLNKARCADPSYKGLTHGDDHDLVTKVQADACQLTITGTPAARFAYGVTGVYQAADDAQEVYTKGEDTVEWDGCGYVVKLDGESQFRTYEGPNCTNPTEKPPQNPEPYNWGEARLYTDRCLKVIGMSSEYFCEEYPRCPTLGYCLVSSPRLDREIEVFRGAIPNTDALCSNANRTERLALIEDYEPKAVADGTRVEYVFNSEAFESNTDGHYLHQELFRDGDVVPRVRLQSLGSASAGVVTLAKPEDDLLELGVSYQVPEGYAAWASDIIRMDRYSCRDVSTFVDMFGYDCAGWAGDCEADNAITDCTGVAPGPDGTPCQVGGVGPDDGGYFYTQAYMDNVRANCAVSCDACGQADTSGVSFEVWLDPAVMAAHAEKDDYFTVFRVHDNGDGTKSFVDVLTEGATIERSTLHHENPKAGWFLVNLATLPLTHGCGAADIAVAVDNNECLDSQCDENALCINTLGGSTCECKPGWVTDGFGQCVAVAWKANPLTVRVENDAALAFGWRLKEIELFTDAECKKPVMQDGKGFFFRRFEDMYCRNNNYLPNSVKNDKCETKCKTPSGQCAGYLKADKNSQAVCMDVNACVEACAADAACSGVDVHDYLPRCYFNKKEEDGTDQCKDDIANDNLGDDVHYALVYKDMHVAASSTSQYEEHPPALAVDGSGHSEWWSGPHKVAALQEYVDVELGGGAVVGSVRVRQHPRHAASQYRVHVGPTSGSLDVKGAVPERTSSYKHLRQAGSSAVEARSHGFTKTVIQKVEKEASPCIDVTCGDSGMFWQPQHLLGPGDVGTYEFVPSACHCKQLCLDHVDEGCRSYAFYHESDTNFWHDPSFHTHGTCYLWSTPYVKSELKPHPDWVSGAPDVVLFGLEPQEAQSGESFSLSVLGVGVSSSDQRIRIVKAEDDCDGDLAGEVVGISCADHVCRPPPAVEQGKASWQVTLHAHGEFKVCYCAGPCFSADQYTSVPGSLTITGAGTFNVPAGLTTATADFEGTVSAEAMYNAKAVLATHLKLVGATGSCADAAVQNVTNATDGAFTVALDGPTFEYLVCLGLGDAADDEWVAIPVVAGAGAPHKYLQLAAVEADWQTSAGIFGNTAASARIGSTATVQIEGRDLGANNGTIALTTAATCAAAAAGYSWSSTLWADGFLDLEPSARTASALTYTIDVTGLAAGKYTLCMCSPLADGADWAFSEKPWADDAARYSAMTGLDDFEQDLYNTTANTSTVEDLLGGGLASSIGDNLEHFSKAVGDKYAAYELALSDFASGYMEESLLQDYDLSRDEDLAGNATLRNRRIAAAWAAREALLAAVEADLVSWNGNTEHNRCGSPSTFSEDAGSFYVTNRADLGVSFVLDADEAAKASLEITGSGLDATKDRVLLVNCQDTCGLAQPTSQATSPEGPHLGAFRYFTPVADELARRTDNPFLVHEDFDVIPSRYCAGNDLIGELRAEPGFGAEGVDVLAAKNLCHKKCVVDGCTGDHCYCDGYLAGDAGTSALCLPTHECEHLCQLLDGCYGVDVHQSTNRCFLKTRGCEAQVADTRNLGLDENFALHVSKKDAWPFSDSAAPTRQTRQITDIDWEKSDRGALVSKSGSSTADVLRFTPIEFAAAGTYKVCFCDSEVQDSCEDASDYGVEIGKVYVTGLAALLAEPKLRTTTCTSMFYGGLSCVA